MASPFLSEIRIFSFSFPPKGWALCNGQLLPINQNQALFSLLGTTYGGDGRVNFALPNLQGRVPFHMGGGHVLGERGGEQSHTLSLSELPSHTHTPAASSAAANNSSPISNFWANAGKSNFNSAANAAMAPQGISSVGGSQAHDNMSPYLVLNICIALQGIFPSQN
jgi:microcystin-dependent protein